jgi:benzoyl-CoA 2,3-dioxygenase component B
MRLRDDYAADCAKSVERWNKIIARTGLDFTLTLPHVAFCRHIGAFRDVCATPSGELIDKGHWARGKDQWLPSLQDGDFIATLMTPVKEPGQFASWIAPPKVGIDNKPGDFEYVKVAA